MNEWPAAVAAKSRQSCLTLCDPIDGSPPGSSVPGILQARTLEWVARMNGLVRTKSLSGSKFQEVYSLKRESRFKSQFFHS